MRHSFWLACGFLFGSCTALASPDSDADVRAGMQIYVQCTGCHAPDYHRTGPLHCGLVGRKAGTVMNFAFTAAMKHSNLVWDRAALDRFLRAPTAVVPGTSMGFAGIASATERRQLIAFLATLTRQNPLCG